MPSAGTATRHRYKVQALKGLGPMHAGGVLLSKSWLEFELNKSSVSPLPVMSCVCCQDALDACNGWEVDRQVEQAMDALR